MWEYLRDRFFPEQPGDSVEPSQDCYYTLLDVPQSASAADIKRAYRTRALQLHPDKNPDRDTTQLFTQIQQAYEVLSDPHERAWYDSHREAILSGRDPSSGTTDEDPREYSGTLISVNQLLRFYSVYSTVFSEILRQEEESLLHDPESLGFEIPDVSFGSASNDWESLFLTRDRHETSVKEFYSTLHGFRSSKSFRWKDKYKLADAPDRRTRRLMEKENKSLRDAARSSFSRTVSELAAFAKKRDPRYKAYLKQCDERQKDAARLLQEKRKKEEQERAAKASGWVEPEWSRAAMEDELRKMDKMYRDSSSASSTTGEDESDALDEGEMDILEEVFVHEGENEFYCIACDVLIKSRNRVNKHAVTRKHGKAVDALREEILADEDILQSATTGAPADAASLPASFEAAPIQAVPTLADPRTVLDEGQPEISRHTFEDEDDEVPVDETGIIPEISDDEYSKSISQRGSKSRKGDKVPGMDISSDDEEIDWAAPSKKGKRRGKNVAPKVQNKTIQVSTDDVVAGIKEIQLDAGLSAHSCNTCRTEFPSRTKLMNHVRSSGHAAAEKVVNTKNGKKGKGRKK